MNKSMFSGWRDVFSFTFKQGISGKNFKPVTISIMLILLLGGMSISVIMAVLQKKDATEVSPIQEVHVIDESGLDVLYLDGFLENYKEKYPELSFLIETAGLEEVNASIQDKMKQASADETEIPGAKEVIIHICEADNGYAMRLYIPETSMISKDDGEKFLEDVTVVMEQSKLMSSDIEMEKMVLAMSNISSTILDAGEEEKSLGEELIAMIFPMLCILFIYMMILLYGQSIGNIVSVEKSSKLMEMMLTMTRPYALIFGKIFAVTTAAIFQMSIWILAFVVGFFLGDIAAKEMIYPGYNNMLIEVMELLSSQEGSTAFSVGAFVLAFVTICISFLFYSVLAGMISSFATKAENLSQTMAIYMMIVLAGFFGAYVVPVQENEVLSTIMRIIPVTSAYLLPGDLVVGNITVWQGALYMAILLVTTLVLVIIAGKVYKNQLFYKGTGLKDRIRKKK